MDPVSTPPSLIEIQFIKVFSFLKPLIVAKAKKNYSGAGESILIVGFWGWFFKQPPIYQIYYLNV